MTPQPIVGQTKDVGFQIGVRKTFPISYQQAWSLMVSEVGIKSWLGETSRFSLEKGQTYQTLDGIEGEVRTVVPGGHFRLTWRPKDWPRASTLQVRLIPNRGKTIISFHQEQLKGEKEREQMRQHWSQVLEMLYALVNRSSR